MYDRKHGRNKKEPGTVKGERQDRKMKSRRSVFPGRETAEREDFLIGGRNSVAESLRAGQVKKIFVKAGKKDGRLEELVHQAAESGITVTEVEEDALSEMTGGIRHQGIAAALRPYEYADLDTVLAEVKEENPILILLDGIEDVRNLGAIVRSAECGGAVAVLLPKHKSSPVTAAAMKTAAGAFAYLPVCQTGNIRQTLESLKKRGFWVVAADMDGDVLYDSDLKRPLVIVMGAEGKGISPLTKKICDFSVRIPMKGKVSSLNVSVAAALILYEAVRQRS